MSRINTNVSSQIAQRVLGQNNASLTKSLERLSTGYRINRGGDDPAGLIASESLRGEKAAIGAGIANAERADQFINVAEGGLQEISSLLIEMQGLVSSSASDAGLSEEEKVANQNQLDGILQAIDRIANTTSFQGTKLLNGGFDFVVSGQTSQVTDFNLNAANVGIDNFTVEANVTQSAQTAGVFLSLDGTALDLSTSNPNFVFEIAGAAGSRQFSFSSGATISTIATAVNSYTGVTGVSAITSGNVVRFNSSEYGSDQFVSIDIINDGDQSGNVGVYNSTSPSEGITVGAVALSAVQNPLRDEGQDVGVTVNGAEAVGKGKSFSVRTDNLDLEVTLNTSGVQQVASFDLFTVTGGGAKFNIGSEVNSDNEVNIGLKSVSARNLGFVEVANQDDDTKDRFATVSAYLDDIKSGGRLNVVDGDVSGAQEAVSAAINQIAGTRGRLGSLQKNVIGSAINSMNVALENVSAAESAIRDTDFAAETAALTRNQILVNASTNVLSITNSQPNNVLNLL